MTGHTENISVILFWILYILSVIGVLTGDKIPYSSISRPIVILILIGILGWKFFGGIS